MNLKYVITSIGVAIIAISIISLMSFSTFESNTVSQESESTTNPTTTQTPEPTTDSQAASLEAEQKIQPSVSQEPVITTKPVVTPEAEQIIKSENIQITNGKKHIVPLDKIRSGGPPKDGIPSIDEPKFSTVSESQFMSDSDIVIGLEINGDKKAYPLFIMVWHEIVNDNVGGVPVAVTYCPLCFTNQVFERIIDGQEVEFGTSGKLYNSNLVMYDRLTDSYWSQALGVAITGELTGYELKRIPFDVINWGDWKTMHPESLVLTTQTGHLRAYGSDPYGDYYTDPRIIFPVENKDERMHPKEIILGFQVGNVFKAFKQADVDSATIINDEINDKPVMLVSFFSENARAFERTVEGQILNFDYTDEKIIDMETKSEWTYNGLAISGPLEGTTLNRLAFDPGFWFEWVAFHPDTQVYERE